MTPHGIDTIFSYAKDLQRNTYRFYSELAGNLGRDQVDWLFEQNAKRTQQDLLDVGQLHLDVTVALEAHAADGKGPNPLSMQWMSDHGGELPKMDPLAELTGNESTDEIVARAAQLEETATTFFTALSHMVAIGNLSRAIKKVADHHRMHWAQCQQLAAMLKIYPTPPVVQMPAHTHHSH